MELVKNFSDETGKEGNPGRFTGHLAQVERLRGCVCETLSSTVWCRRGVCATTGGGTVTPTPPQPRMHTQVREHTYPHLHHSRTRFIHASFLPQPRYELLQTITAPAEQALCLRPYAQHTCPRTESRVCACAHGRSRGVQHPESHVQTTSIRMRWLPRCAEIKPRFPLHLSPGLSSGSVSLNSITT